MPGSSAPRIRSVDLLFLDEVFEMGGGYVLDFSNATFSAFFAQELQVNIDDAFYAVNGSSKAKRLRCFFQTAGQPLVIRALQVLWEYREALRLQVRRPEAVANAAGRMEALINRLAGHAAAPPAARPPEPARVQADFAALKAELMSLASLAPHARGYAFESFLKKLFDAFGLAAREPFSLRGEQIDGSFRLDGEIYLVEAKWHAQPVGVAELHTFHGKLDQKAAWTRGLFVSESGFTEDGLQAFGRGKRLICMDGLDLYDSLDRGMPLDQVLARKVRIAGETGRCFVRVRDFR